MIMISLSQNLMKPIPSQSAHHVESGIVFGSSNRVCMKKLFPFEVFEEQGKMMQVWGPQETTCQPSQ